MAQKRGKKRPHSSIDLGAGSNGNGSGNGSNGGPPQPPDRTKWTGWVEMESEPAFFNVMLKEMGVRGVKIQEVVSLDDQMMAFLPRPVHALIFLFRYREEDREQQSSDGCPKHVWFANQTPEFACATFALLNTVFNIPGLEVGKELCEFKSFTQNMEPMARGDAVDEFDFVRRIHNSFARESDMLQADMFVKNKAEKLKKRFATQKARETREAKKLEQEASKNMASKDGPPAARSSARQRTSTSRKNTEDDEYKTDQGAQNGDETKPPPRRSQRPSKPRQDPFATAAADEGDGEGFHFVAYMPISGRVWRLDGLDRYPQDMGSSEEIGKENWMTLVQPALESRMAQFAGAELEFNLMAVVHDSTHRSRQELLRNVKTIQEVDRRLDAVMEEWRSLDGGETVADLVTTDSEALGISVADVSNTVLPDAVRQTIDSGKLPALLALRKEETRKQARLRALVRDAAGEDRDDAEKARHQRHDYSTFVRSWLRALAEEEVLSNLLAA